MSCNAVVSIFPHMWQVSPEETQPARCQNVPVIIKVKWVILQKDSWLLNITLRSLVFDDLVMRLNNQVPFSWVTSPLQTHKGLSDSDLWLSSITGSSFWQCKTFSVMFWNAFASILLQNRADKKRLNIIIVAEGAIDSHNKAITPDYIKEVSTVEKSGHVTEPQTLLQKHGPFFPSWFAVGSLQFFMSYLSFFLFNLRMLSCNFFHQSTHSLIFLQSAYLKINKCFIPFPPSAPLFFTFASSRLHAHYLALGHMTGDILHDFSICCFVFSNVSHLHSPFYFCSFLILRYYVILQTIKHVLMLY